MPPRTVAYLTPLYFDEASCLGGGERYPLNLARGVHLASNGRCLVELISFGDTDRRLPMAEGVTLRVLPAVSRPANPLDVVSWALPEALSHFDLIHIHQAYTRCSEMGLLIARQQRKPVCITDHGGATSTLGREIGHLELANCIIAYSDFGASLYKTSRPIHVVKGGVDASLFTPPEKRSTRDRVLFVGRLLPHKGIDRLIAALPSHLPLTVCGRPYHPEFFERLKAMAKGKRVQFVTDANDETIRQLYAKSWANVLSSVYLDCDGNTHEAPELMGFTLLEAMACGTPGIASRVGAMPEFIREGETGFVYDDLQQLTAQLLQLANNSTLVDTMGQSAAKVVKSEFDLTVAGAKMLAIYESLWRQSREVAA